MERDMFKKYLCCLVIFFSFPGLVAAADLQVNVDNIKTLKGNIMIALFSSSVADGFPNEASRSAGVSVKPIVGGVSAQFNNIAAGEYAVAVYHDKNGNNKLDVNFFGIPKEPYGFSGDKKTSLGKPEFSVASFVIGDGELLSIRVSL